MPEVRRDGIIRGCLCERTEFVQIIDGMVSTAECRPCLESIDYCNECTLHGDECRDCMFDYFIDASGECTTESCRSWNTLGDCVECNTRENVLYMP